MARVDMDDVPTAGAGARNRWFVEQLRLTAFPTAGAPRPGPARDWWTLVVGQPPESVQEQPQKGSVQLHGKHDDGQLVMNANAQRFDIRKLFTPADPSSMTPEYSTACGPFVELASRWLQLENGPPLQRLAFGAVVTGAPSTELEGCRDVLGDYLPAIDMTKVGLRDFVYQTNRRVSSEVINGVEINRLSKWIISTVQDVTLTSIGVPLAHRVLFTPRLEVDINSDSQTTLRSNRLAKLLGEFVRHADQIVMSGDHS